jgi:hypothetical protein
MSKRQLFIVCFLRSKPIMLRTLKEVEGFAIHADDGDLGEIKEFYFDDRQWVIRYFVVETGTWLSSKKVLLSPISIKHVNHEDKILSVSISRKQVENSPDIDTQKPVSRQHEADHLGSPYMIAPGYASVAPQPDEGHEAPDIFADIEVIRHRDQDHHLRSTLAVTGYHFEALDGDLGHLQGMLIDTDTWAIRHLIINTSNWWLGHQVLIAPQSIKEISWTTSTLYVDMTQQQVKDAPLFEPDIPVNRE